MKNAFIFNVRCFAFLDALLGQISRGLRGYDGRQTVSVEALRGLFAQVCMRHDIPLNFEEGAKLPKGIPDRLLELQQAYIAFIGSEKAWFGAKVYSIVDVPAQALSRQRKLFRPVRAKNNLKGLDFAIAMAEDNLGRSNDRLAALRFLDTFWGMHGWPTDEARQCWGEAYSKLVQNVNRFSAELMRLVLVQGDAARIDELRKQVYESYFRDGVAVAEYLQPEGNLSGGWLGDEEKFRQDMKTSMSHELNATVD
jgi:hypothetical protein